MLCTLVAAAVLLTRWRQGDPTTDHGAGGVGDAVLPRALAATLDRSLERDGTRRAAALAIRPLRGAADDRDAQALADWLCDTLATRLARPERVRVSACASARVALASELDDTQLARLLAVDHLLRGRLERLGDERVRVRIEMVRPGAGYPLWAIDAEYDSATLQQLSAQVARRVAEALGQGSTGDEVETIPAAAYARYLLATRRAAQGGLDDLRAALGLVDEALATAPDYAPALLLRLNLLDHLGDSPTGSKPTTTAEHLAAHAHWIAGMEALARRLLDEAAALYRAASEAAGVDPRWVEAVFRGLADPARREEVGAALDAMPAELRFAMINFFLQYAVLGDVERAVRGTRDNLDYPPGDWMRHWWSPEFAVVRRDPRFAELADKAGLLALWRVRGAPDLYRFEERGVLQCR